jgi:4-hydroxy-3-polyprenylbenzoate decarboxylase
MKEEHKRVIVGISGASGAMLALTMVDTLLDRKIPTTVVTSGAARMVWQQEMDQSFGEQIEKWSDYSNFEIFPIGDFTAPIASGSYPTLGMVIIPCSMATISAISNGLSDNLIRRAADVCLKEQRKLVIVPRESPLSAIHLDNMSKLAKIGVTILPSDPPYYLGINSLKESADFLAQRGLMALGVTNELPDHMQYKGRL